MFRIAWLPAALLAPTMASAHISLLSPAKRYDDQKVGPCGAGASDARTPNVTTFQPGATITVEWEETINHPSHYRIAFDADGADDFVDPATQYEFFSNSTVLADNIPDDPSGLFAVEVTLPDVECDDCTLQIIQVMYDKPPYEPGTNDLYYQCADLVLSSDATGTTPTGTTDTDTDTDADADDTGLGADEAKGCGCATPAAPWAGWALLMPLAALRRRR